MKHTNRFLAWVSAVALLGSVGCGSYNLKTITLTAAASTTVGGYYELQGEGGTLQLQATGNYSNNTSKDVTPRVTYTVTPTGYINGDSSDPLPAPPSTMTVSATGLLTAVQPFACTYENAGTTSTAVWVLTGSYEIVANFDGVTSQPIYVGVASAAGPGGLCGPTN